MKAKQMVWRGLGMAGAVLLLLFQCSPPLAAQYQGNVAKYQDQGQYQGQQYQGQYQGQYEDQGPQGSLLTPDQLDNLVAPIALYPDRLLSQILVASTYPQEVADAGQWLQQNRGLRGQQLVEAAQQQNWDPSVQALVVFPDAVARLTSDMQWTADLGNAFLAQQADVMAAVQRMRARARANGRLRSNSQEIVTEQYQDGQPYVDIEPANPDVVYVPYYDPAYVWGPPVYGYYPPLVYPAYGFGYYPGIYLTGFFGGWGGWGGWGWYPNWFGGRVFLNAGFFGHFGFHHFDRDDFGRRFDRGFRSGAWTHDPQHRLGVPYSNRTVANRFGGNFSRSAAFNGGRFNGGNNGGFANRGNFGNFGNRSGFANPGTAGTRNGQFGRQGFTQTPGTNRSFQGGAFNGGRTNQGFSQPGMNRQFQQRTPGMNPGTGSNPGQWNRFNGPNSQPGFRSNPNPSFRGGNNNFGSFRNEPTTQSAPAFRGNGNFGGVRGGSAAPPAFGNSNGAFHAAPPAQSAPAFRDRSNFGGFRSAPPAQSAPTFRGNSNFGGFRNAPASNPSPAFRGGGNFGGGQPSFHSAPEFRGNGGGGFSRPAQSFGGGGGFHGGGGGGGFHSNNSGGGGGFHGGGGGSHEGGGGHGRR